MLTLLLLLNLSLARAIPTVVFDLDHTLIDTVPRIIEIMRDIGQELDLPSLTNLTPADIALVRRGNFSVLKLTRAERLRAFGQREDDTIKSSAFGRRFYRDPSYLRHDGVIPGAPEFVRRVVDAIGFVRIVYLSGRFDTFKDETERQLRAAGFPGSESSRPTPSTLILRPEHTPGTTDAFKIAQFAGLGEIIGVFDDSRRNVNAFAEVLPDYALIVRITNDVEDRTNLHPRIRLLKDYASDPAEVARMIETLKSCANWLT